MQQDINAIVLLTYTMSQIMSRCRAKPSLSSAFLPHIQSGFLYRYYWHTSGDNSHKSYSNVTRAGIIIVRIEGSNIERFLLIHNHNTQTRRRLKTAPTSITYSLHKAWKALSNTQTENNTSEWSVFKILGSYAIGKQFTLSSLVRPDSNLAFVVSYLD